PASGYVIVSVSDNGIGMAPEVRERATEPFFSTKEGAGSGLGLSMAYGFCQQSGGYLDIDSSLGQGTTVSLYLPRAESRPEVPPLEAPGPGRTAARAGGARDGRVVLVVEDSDEMRRFSALAVTTLGYEVAEAADMEAALTALRQKPGISLLFTDILLGNGQNGLDLAKQARAIVPDIGVVMTSGFADHEAIRETVEALGARFLAKPFRVEDLARVLEEVAAASGVSRPVAV
ncbi:MAG TPA: response regulator, partial [Woeseiaceae bacterium]|nr:response regulator [Woeseiaceae bacterium]